MSGTLPRTLDEAVLVALRDSVGGDDAFVADLVETYIADGADQVAAIGAAVAAGDPAALVRPAHTLKSASYTIGAMRLGAQARALEQRGRTEGLDGAEADSRALIAEWGSVTVALRGWLATPR